MARREIIRLVLAINWCLAAIACNMALHGHASIWRSICLKLAAEDMQKEGIEDPYSNELTQERYSRGEELRRRLNTLENVGEWGWKLAMFGFAGTAIGLMIGFPKPEQPARPDTSSEID